MLMNKIMNQGVKILFFVVLLCLLSCNKLQTNKYNKTLNLYRTEYSKIYGWSLSCEIEPKLDLESMDMAKTIIFTK